MTHKHETRGAMRSRAPLVSAVAADIGDNTETPLMAQASRLCRCFKLSHELTRVLVEVVFPTGEATIIPPNASQLGVVLTAEGREATQAEARRFVREGGLNWRKPEGASHG